MFFSIFILGLIIILFIMGKTKKRIKHKNTNTNTNKKESFTNTNTLSLSQCSNILKNKEKKCNCFDKRGFPTTSHQYCMQVNHQETCDDYNVCKQKFLDYMTGSEPEYDLNNWNDPIIESSHNCYAYFLDDHIPVIKKKCEGYCPKFNIKNGNRVCNTKPKKCDDLKPQPGDFAVKNGDLEENEYKYNCKTIVDKVLLDNLDKTTGKSLIKKVNFNEKCPANHYKGAVVVHPEKTYHFYRQDNNGRFSHKQGTLSIENVDASGNPIWSPHDADRDYKKDKKEGINYTDFCSYLCVPHNLYRQINQ
jgi:hypothetical protein